ncbi:type III secretion system protein [Salmonella enterica]
MKIEDERIMHILYSPAAYIHPSHLPESLRNGDMWSDVLLNYWIVTSCQLDDVAEQWQPRDITSSLILSHWQRLPGVAHLIGGYLLRNELMRQGAALMTDTRLLSFISLPLLHHINTESNKHNSDTAAWGLAFLLGLVKEVPRAFQQRMRLCFPAEIKLPDFHTAKTPHHINLLKMAIAYANDFQQ